MKTLLVAAVTSVEIGVAVLIPLAGLAQTGAPNESTGNYPLIDRQIASNNPIEIRVMAGRATTIDFTQSDEVIEHVLLADPSQTVYTADAPIDSGQTKVLYLRRIHQLNFPGATKAYVTNLQVRTADKQGRTRNYVFNVVPIKPNNNYIGIRITNNPQLQPVTVAGQQVTAEDLEAGLRIAIRNGYTSANDPIVSKIQGLIEQVRSGMPLRAAAQSSRVSIQIITALAQMSYQNKATPARSRQSQIPAFQSAQTLQISKPSSSQ